MTPSDLGSAIAALGAIRADFVATGIAVREQHGRGEGLATLAAPDAVAFPKTVDEVQEATRICAARAVPIIPFGSGSSLEGHVTAPCGGICFDLSGMNRIVAVRPDDLDCSVEPGVTREQLNAHLRDLGLFFPIDPGANATIGGMAATRASGTTAVRYGTMREAILALSVVLPDGRLIRTASRARKSAAGYDLTRLFVGSEGTLGTIVGIDLRLHGIPEQIASAVCTFSSLDGAAQAVMLAIQSGIPIARIELLDEVQIAACNAYSNTTLAEMPTLFFEFHGTPASVEADSELIRDIAASFGGGKFHWSPRPEDRNALWKARHNAYFAALAIRPGKTIAITDVCVPVSQLAECVIATRRDIDGMRLVAPIVGHVGDGNFHVLVAIDPADPSERHAFEEFNDRLVARALAAGGTCTGEHGIGAGKQTKLVAELGEDAVGLMRAIKSAIDPLSIMNPGKIFAPGNGDRHGQTAKMM